MFRDQCLTCACRSLSSSGSSQYCSSASARSVAAHAHVLAVIHACQTRMVLNACYPERVEDQTSATAVFAELSRFRLQNRQLFLATRKLQADLAPRAHQSSCPPLPPCALQWELLTTPILYQLRSTLAAERTLLPHALLSLSAPMLQHRQLPPRCLARCQLTLKHRCSIPAKCQRT